MRRQDEQIAWQPRLQRRQRTQPFTQGITLRLSRPDRNVGGYARQDLIARQKDAVALTPQADMFG
ncbi:hypothetical protein D3C71_2232010 [compost metagenome]